MPKREPAQWLYIYLEFPPTVHYEDMMPFTREQSPSQLTNFKKLAAEF